jgi:hypothetical protein
MGPGLICTGVGKQAVAMAGLKRLASLLDDANGKAASAQESTAQGWQL